MRDLITIAGLVLFVALVILTVRSRRASTVAAFLFAAACLVPFVWLIAWPGVALFGSAAIVHAIRGRERAERDHYAALR